MTRILGFVAMSITRRCHQNQKEALSQIGWKRFSIAATLSTCLIVCGTVECRLRNRRMVQAATVQPKLERWLLIERWLEATGSTQPENAVATVLLGKTCGAFPVGRKRGMRIAECEQTNGNGDCPTEA